MCYFGTKNYLVGASFAGQILDRQLKPKKASKELSTEERNKYLEDAKMFARSLAETLNEPDGMLNLFNINPKGLCF